MDKKKIKATGTAKGIKGKTSTLSNEEEKNFQRWIKNSDWHKEYKKTYKEEPDLNTPVYDYRNEYKVWKKQTQPAKFPTVRVPEDKNRLHWSDRSKSSSHPTFYTVMRETSKTTGKSGTKGGRRK